MPTLRGRSANWLKTQDKYRTESANVDVNTHHSLYYVRYSDITSFLFPVVGQTTWVGCYLLFFLRFLTGFFWDFLVDFLNSFTLVFREFKVLSLPSFLL